jgi:hypothetical protein
MKHLVGGRSLCIRLSRGLICKHHLQGIILEEGIPVIKEQHLRNVVGFDNVIYIVVEVPWVDYDDFSIVLSQERYETVGVGVFDQQQVFT